MTALLTDNLPLLAGAPNGIKKLRELILELAVRGKLVPQDSGDEPASALLKQIAHERARLVAEGKIKKPKPLEKIAAEEWPFVLPAGWEWSRLGHVSTYIQRGKGPAYVVESDFRVVSQKCVRWTGLDLQPARFIAPESLVKYESIRFLRSGDILWNSTGTGTIGRACVVEKCSEDEQLVADSHVTVVRPTGLLPVFLWRWIQSPSVQSALEGNASGTTNQIELNTSTVIAHVAPIPPLTEQHRIVAKVDELMALCDRLEAQQDDAESAHAQLVQALLDSLTQASDAADFASSWQRLAEHFHTLFTTGSSIDALKQTLLQLAVMGKLVPQDPSDEPASELLRRVREINDKLERTFSSEAGGDDAENWFGTPAPTGWSICKVSNIAEVKLGSTPSRAELSYWGGDIPWVSSGEVAGTIIESTRERITLAGHKNSSTTMIPSGSVLIAMIGQGKTRGQSALLGIEACTNQNVAALIFNTDLVSSRYVWLWAQAMYSLHRAGGHGGAQPALNAKKIKAFSLPLPPTAEQHRIVAKVDQIIALCQQLKTRLSKAREVNQQLASALVEQATA